MKFKQIVLIQIFSLFACMDASLSIAGKRVVAEIVVGDKNYFYRTSEENYSNQGKRVDRALLLCKVLGFDQVVSMKTDKLLQPHVGIEVLEDGSRRDLQAPYFPPEERISASELSLGYFGTTLEEFPNEIFSALTCKGDADNIHMLAMKKMNASHLIAYLGNGKGLKDAYGVHDLKFLINTKNESKLSPQTRLMQAWNQMMYDEQKRETIFKGMFNDLGKIEYFDNDPWYQDFLGLMCIPSPRKMGKMFMNCVGVKE